MNSPTSPASPFTVEPLDTGKMQHDVIGLFQQREHRQAQFVHLLTEDDAPLAAHHRYTRLGGYIQPQFHRGTLAAERDEVRSLHVTLLCHAFFLRILPLAANRWRIARRCESANVLSIIFSR